MIMFANFETFAEIDAVMEKLQKIHLSQLDFKIHALAYVVTAIHPRPQFS